MRIIVFGATGPTGRQLVSKALEQGHDVTAYARTPRRVTIRHARLRVVQGDVLDAVAVDAAVAGHDAVLSALGATHRKDGSTVSRGTEHIVAAMRKHGVKRLIVQSAVGVGDSQRQAGILFGKILMPLFLHTVFADKARQEDLVRASGLDWTIVRPTGLTNKPGRGQYQVETDDVPVPWNISRADVADFMLRQLDDRTYVRRAPAIGG
jgi:putative NADH-flavin reductase